MKKTLCIICLGLAGLAATASAATVELMPDIASITGQGYNSAGRLAGNGITAADVQKILNLKHAWEFILDHDVAACRSDYYMLSHIARLVNEGFFAEGGRIRGVPVTIGGSSYVPPLPNEADIKDRIREITQAAGEPIDIAIKLCLYCMKTQIFTDGNKRASVIFANHYLISHGGGFLVIPEKKVPEFKRLLVKYYDGEDISTIADFMKQHCRKTM